MIEVFMPKAGMDMEEGRVIKWLKEVGDPVERDEPIMEIETDKISMEAESPGTGVLLAKLVEDDTVVPVLEVIGYIGQPGEKIPEQAEKKEQKPTAPQPLQQPQNKSDVAAVPSRDGAVLATPYAKALAKERGIDMTTVVPSGKQGEIRGADVQDAAFATPLAKRMAKDMGVALPGVQGSGHHGKILKDDLLAHLQQADTREEEEICVPIRGVRKVIAQRMLKSHAECPTVTQHMKVDVTRLLALRAELNEGREQKISINDWMIKIVAQAVAEHPLARTMIRDDMLVTRPHSNIGFAVGMDEGLLVPVIRQADKLPLSEISRQAKDLAARTRTNEVRPDELAGGTFTISNMGMFDLYAFTPIINQPESGILGVNAVEDELYFKQNGEIGVKKVMMISLTYDHRIMDGVGAAKLQLRIKELMENPLLALC